MWCRSWNLCKTGGHGISSKIPEPWNKSLYCLGDGQMPWNMFRTQKVTLASCWVGGSFICDTCYVFCIILSSDFPHSIVIILQMSFIFCSHHLLNCTVCSFRVEIVFSTSPSLQMLAECLKKCRLLVSACQQLTKLLNVWMNICIGKAMHFCWMLNEWTVMIPLSFSCHKTEGLNEAELLLLLLGVQSWGSQWVKWAGLVPLLDFLSTFGIDGMVEIWFSNSMSFAFCSGAVVLLEAERCCTPSPFKKS